MSTVLPGWVEVCARCSAPWDLEERRWRCRCGGLLDLIPQPGADPDPRLPEVDLGQAVTRLVAVDGHLSARWLKLEYSLPTGSFKARGASTMLSLASSLGVGQVVVDSSGNAGKAVAAYAAASGLRAEIHVPGSTDPSKVQTMRDLGAEVVVAAGDRDQCAQTAVARVEAGAGWYASHVYQPAFHHGVKTMAYEIVDQMAARGESPGTVVVPAGNGTLVLGLWLGFREMAARGRIGPVPALVAVQSERCAPLAGLVPSGLTAAAGIAITRPPRLGQVRAAVAASGGRVVPVSEDAIASARSDLAGLGYPVEPTGAVSWALRDAPWMEGSAVFVVTGS